jgi:hypothetical protein
MAAFCFIPFRSPLFETALVFVRLYHVASIVVNTNHTIM